MYDKPIGYALDELKHDFDFFFFSSVIHRQLFARHFITGRKWAQTFLVVFVAVHPLRVAVEGFCTSISNVISVDA